MKVALIQMEIAENNTPGNIVHGLDLLQEAAANSDIAVLPEWQPAEGVITAVFPSRRGLMPSVRSLIDFLGEAFEAP